MTPRTAPSLPGIISRYGILVGRICAELLLNQSVPNVLNLPMPRTLRLSDGSYMRRLDVQHILQSLHTMQCVQVVGLSNIGKSALLRLLAQPDVWSQELG